jgi:hypothetical protein
MNARAITVRIGALAASLLTTLAIGGPAAQGAPADLASSVVVVAPTLTPSDCGKYTTAGYTDLTLAVAGRTTGTVLVCPGTYPTLSGPVEILNANKLIIKAALTGTGSRPYLKTGAGAAWGIHAVNSTSLTIDGLIIDVTGSANATGIEFEDVSGAIRNTTVIGSTSSSYGIRLDNTGLTKARNISLTNSQVIGYVGWGVHFTGQGKLTMTGNLLDGRDGGRVGGAASGVVIYGRTSDVPGPTASISKNSILHHSGGIVVDSASKVSITGNHIVDTDMGVFVFAASGAGKSADGTKISGNTITGVTSIGILLENNDPANVSILKTIITGNTISAATYTPNGAGLMGVRAQSLSTPGRVSVSISKNTFIGFPITPAILYITNLNSDVTIGSNVRTP